MPLGNIVQFKTLSDNMARFLALSMAGVNQFLNPSQTLYYFSTHQNTRMLVKDEVYGSLSSP